MDKFTSFKTIPFFWIILLIGCSSISPSPSTNQPIAIDDAPQQVASTYAELAKTSGKVFLLDPQKSAIRIHVFRGGRLAGLGHNHVLSAPRFTGYAAMPSNKLSDARFDLIFRLDELELDNPALRSKLGAAFESKLPAAAINSTREHLLGENNFQAQQFPYVTIRSLQIVGEAPKLAVHLQINLHGQTRALWVPINMTVLPDSLSVSGSFVLLQTDFGVQPYSSMGGLLAVQDQVVVDWELVALLFK